MPHFSPSLVAALALLGGAVCPSGIARAQTVTETGGRVFAEQPVQRDGAHFQVGFGPGFSTEGVGLFHIMEVGGTFGGGYSVSVLHTFFQNRGLLPRRGGADLFGGWFLEFGMPLVVPELIVKVAAGLGVEHDQSNGSLRPSGGFGWAYGIDFNIPVDARHGPTVGALAVHTLVEGRHAFGVGIFFGWTVY